MPLWFRQKVQKDITNKEFVVLETTQPYQGSITDYKAELEAAKAKEIVRHDGVIADCAGSGVARGDHLPATVEIVKDVIAIHDAARAVAGACEGE